MSLREYILTGIVLFLFSGFIAYLVVYNSSPQKANTSLAPQKAKSISINIDSSKNSPITVKARTLPQFIVKLIDEKFKNIWQVDAAERPSLISANIKNLDGSVSLALHTSFDEKQKDVVISPESDNKVKPGLYTLSVNVKTYRGEDITITQDFRWGVLAINTDKGVYQPSDTVKVGMGVLGDLGNTKCIAKSNVTYDTAKVWLKITSPSGFKESLSTDDGGIVGSKDCAPTSITNNPDFQAEFTVKEVGTYTIHMTAQTIKGMRSIDYLIKVQDSILPFIVLRTSYPTRIYPYGHYPVEIKVIANKDYKGIVSDFVPNSFVVTNISGYGQAEKTDIYQRIDWSVDFKEGQTYTLSYEIKFPPVSPEFYLVGPLTIGDFREGREWEVASDAISLVQSAQNVTNSGTSVSATFGSSVTTNDLDVLICSETGSATINNPSSSGGRSWSRPSSLSVTSTPRIRMFYRRSSSSESTTFTCSFSSSSGVKAIQMFEYAGIATSSQLDGHGKLNGSNSCNSSPYEADVSLSATNGNELIISSHVATSTRNVNSHTSGFTQEYGFNGSSGTFTSADQTITDPGSYNDTATFSGPGGTCSGVIASFITPVTLTQNGYRFFQNANSITPGSPIDAQNTDITLPIPHDPFRLRFLVDVDGNQTVSIGGIDLILQYAQVPISGDCSTLQDTDWNPVTDSTPIAYNVNSLSGGSGTDISSSGNDPSDTTPHSYTTYYEDYYESFSGDGSDDIMNLQNSLSNNRAGLWDVSLIDNTDDSEAVTYCLDVANGDGTGAVSGDLDSYLYYPKVTTFHYAVKIKGGTTIKGKTLIQ